MTNPLYGILYHHWLSRYTHKEVTPTDSGTKPTSKQKSFARKFAHRPENCVPKQPDKPKGGVETKPLQTTTPKSTAKP